MRHRFQHGNACNPLLWLNNSQYAVTQASHARNSLVLDLDALSSALWWSTSTHPPISLPPQIHSFDSRLSAASASRRFCSSSRRFCSASRRFCSCMAAIGLPSAACCRIARSSSGSSPRAPSSGSTPSMLSSKRFRGRSPYCVKKPSRIGVNTTPRSDAGYTMMCAAGGAAASLPVLGSAPALELYAMWTGPVWKPSARSGGISS
mmetsp:Transcript_13070/g.26968  ORF Transcript_13070/g.26968 Transcript_13070/m.26968 type:complete len:205 (+) Transcript_13070:676-1290(+)